MTLYCTVLHITCIIIHVIIYMLQYNMSCYMLQYNMSLMCIRIYADEPLQQQSHVTLSTLYVSQSIGKRALSQQRNRDHKLKDKRIIQTRSDQDSCCNCNCVSQANGCRTIMTATGSFTLASSN